MSITMGVVMAISAAGCGGSDAREDNPGGLTKIRLGWQKVPMTSANYLMAQEGHKYGLDIELVEFNRYTDMRVALENGSIDFGTIGPGDMALSADSGRSDMVVLAGEATGADLIAKRADAGPLTWKDLASGKVPFGSFGAGIAWVKTVATLDEQGHDIGDVDEIKVAGSIFDVMQTLKSGGTQVVMNVDPAIAQGAKEGYAEYADELDINSSSLGGQNSLFVANEDMLERPEVVKKVLRNYVDQLERLAADRALWATTFQGYTGIDKSVAEESLKRIQLSVRFSRNELSAFAKFLTGKGIAKNPELPEIVKDRYQYEFLAEVTGKSEPELGK
ncbi:ABC transporter substrate-binding protein [Streptosporangium roseum]|uniref:ABC transporter substrate-binding protein n=1 Tax=Streptosporangium roseum TaxID=2001 RepID=UPI003316DC09